MSTPDHPEQGPTLPHTMRNRQPWPMWPIALAVLLFIGIYTYINLEYRKEGQAYEPFQSMMDRKNAIVEKNIYDWYGLAVDRAEDQSPISQPLAAIVTEAKDEDVLESDFPEQLKYSVATKPILLPGPIEAESPQTLTLGEPLRLQLSLPAGLATDERFHLLAFYKEGVLYLLATLFVDEFSDAESAITGEPTPVVFAVPSDPMEAEEIEVRFLSGGHLSQWSIQTKP